MKKYLAELLGTFTLTLAVGLSLSGRLNIPTLVVAALVVGLMVYLVGGISGAHLNPSITVGAWSIKKLSTRDAGWYVVAQFIGAILAMLLAKSTIGIPGLIVGSSSLVILGELIGTFFLAMGVASVALGKTSAHVSGLVVGLALLVGVVFAALLGSNGVLNPAVALGIGSLNLVYFLSPIVGSVLGMQFYKYISQ